MSEPLASPSDRSLIEMIGLEFPPGQPLSLRELMSPRSEVEFGCLDEERRVAIEFFRDRRWCDVTEAALNGGPPLIAQALPLISTSSQYYLFPAYMVMALDGSRYDFVAFSSAILHVNREDGVSYRDLVFAASWSQKRCFARFFAFAQKAAPDIWNGAESWSYWSGAAV